MRISDGPKASLGLTHIIYDDSSLFSLALALITLTPILLMASYAALAVQTREFLIIVMWAGQVVGEIFSWVLKHLVKQERPIGSVGNGFGFPSSHSQYMGYFSSFLICHLLFRHRFSSTGAPIIDRLWRTLIYLALLAWASLVAYSRHYLGYHNAHQIFWGLGIGVVHGVSLYIVSELLPRRRPTSRLGQLKAYMLSNPISTWLQIRDGWAVWEDAGREFEWRMWRQKWETQQKQLQHKRTQ